MAGYGELHSGRWCERLKTLLQGEEIGNPQNNHASANPSALSKHQRGREDQGDSADDAREKLKKILLEMGRRMGGGGGGGD